MTDFFFPDNSFIRFQAFFGFPRDFFSNSESVLLSLASSRRSCLAFGILVKLNPLDWSFFGV